MFEAVVLGFGLCIAIISLFKPIPYGRFTMELPLTFVPNRWFLFLVNLPCLIALLVTSKGFTSENLGLAATIFLSTHFFIRSIVVPLTVAVLYTSDKKQVSLLTVLISGTYNTFVGLMLGHMCQRIVREITSFDYAIMIAAGVCLLLNVFFDVYINYLRCYGEVEVKDMYVTREEIAKLFKLLDYAGITSPNYLFEFLEWLLLTIVLWNIEMVCYLFATTLILWIRAVSIQEWFNNL